MSDVTATALRRLETALLESHGSEGVQPGELAEYADAPERFITEVLGGEVHAPHRAVIEAVRDHRTVAVKGCHGSAKDWTVARLVLWWVYACAGRAIVSGPTLHQVNDIIMDGELRRAWRGARRQLAGELFATRLKTDHPYAGVLAVVATSDAKYTGLHAPRTMVVITEANAVPAFAYEGLSSNALAPSDKIVTVGNALASSESWFRHAFRLTSGWHTLTITADDVFASGINVAGGVAIPGMMSPEWRAAKISEYGPGSPFVVGKIDAQFPDVTADSALATRAWLERAADLWRSGSLLSLREPHVLGLDVGREGDPSALAHVRSRHVVSVETFPSPTGDVAAAHTIRKARDLTARPYGPGIDDADVAALVVDVIGIGAAAQDAFTRANVPIVEWRSNARATEPALYANARAEAGFTLRTLLDKGELALPPDEELWEEILAHRWFTNAHGRVQLLDKRDVRDAIGRSPNKFDAVIQALAQTVCGGSIGGAICSF